MIQKAKDTQDINDLTDACLSKWPEEAFKNTKFQENTQAIFVKRGQINLLDKTPYQNNIPALKKIDNDCPKIVTIESTETINGVAAISNTTLVITLEDTGTPESFIETLKELEERLSKCPGKLQIKTTTGNPNQLRKAYELVKWKIDKTAYIVMPGKTPRLKTESVVVKPGDMTYADLVKKIRDNVNGEELGVRILNAKKNTDGHLEMRVKGQTSRLTDSLKRVVPGVKTAIKTTMTTLHIRDLEEEVTTNDIIKGIEQALPMELKDHLAVKSIRPAYNNTCRATVQLPPDPARILHRRGHIQIGLVSARIRIRSDIQRCSRCWQDGHSPQDCTGEDMRGRCFLCKAPGHIKAQCTKAKDIVRTAQQTKNA